METGYDVNHLVQQARSRWLTPAEVLFILQNHDSKMRLQGVPQRPSSGSLFLYDRNSLPSFRKDGHNWRKKPHKEGHERLKVQTIPVLNCYYATGEYNQCFKRRSYWMLDEANKDIVLVHYRDTTEDNTNSASNLAFSSGQSSTFTQSFNCALVNQATASLNGMHGSSQSLSSLQSPEHKFEIRAISPEWCFANEVTRVIIIGSFHCDPSEIAWVMFGDRAVPVQIMQDGVICCDAPPKCPGKVTLCITCSNLESCSEVKDFEYRDRNSSCNNCITGQQEKSRNMEEGQLLVKLAQMLLSDSSLHKGEGNNFNIDPSRTRNGYENSRDYITEAELKDCSSLSDWVLRELLKDKLQQWLSTRILDGFGTLSKKEKGIIHIVAGLGYEWALHHILASGVGVNFRDTNGWTALHWAARFGREKMVSELIENGAAVGAISHPTAQDPTGNTPASIADANGHKGLAGYLSEVELSTHFSSLTFKEEARSVHVEAEADPSCISMEFVASAEDQSSMKEVLAASRNANQDAALILEAFRILSFRKRQQRDAANLSKVDEYGLTPNEILRLSAAALTIQNCYRGWKRRKYFLTKLPQVVKIQAHMRGYRVRKYYKVIWAVGIMEKIVLRWYRGRAGLRGFKPVDENEEEDEDDILRAFRRKRVYTSIREAVKRVQSMIPCRQARDQYCRMLQIFHQAKAKLGVSTNEEALTSLVDAFPMDNDNVGSSLQLPPDSFDYSDLWDNDNVGSSLQLPPDSFDYSDLWDLLEQN